MARDFYFYLKNPTLPVHYRSRPLDLISLCKPTETPQEGAKRKRPRNAGEGRGKREGERRWFVLERPRRDTNGGSESEVTVTSKLPSKGGFFLGGLLSSRVDFCARSKEPS